MRVKTSIKELMVPLPLQFLTTVEAAIQREKPSKCFFSLRKKHSQTIKLPLMMIYTL